MTRKRSPEREKAFELWKKSKGERPIRDIAGELGVPEKTISGWKCKDKWEYRLTGVLQPKKRSTAKKKGKQSTAKKEFEKSIVENDKLNEKQKLFCLYYVKNFNATQSAIKAGYSKDCAHVTGPRLMGNVSVRAEIRKLKGKLHEELFVDAMDVLNVYAAIAFSDITEYVNFGQKEVPVLTKEGPVVDADGNPVTRMVNYVDFNPSAEIDGKIINEISQGRDGVKIKMADKMKALEKLEHYFDLIPDKWKRKVEEERLEIEKRKLEGADVEEETARTKEAVGNFIEALGLAAEDVWKDEGKE